MPGFSSFTVVAQQSNGGTSKSVIVTIGVVLFVVLMATLLALGPLVSLYIQALVSGAGVDFVQLVGMRLRKVDVRTIVYGRIRTAKSGLDITADQLETHFLAGGRVQQVISALIAAQGARIPLSWDMARAIDLAGRDIVAVVESAVNPTILECPGPVGTDSVIHAAAQDGVKLTARVWITARTSIDRYVGGAAAEVLIARVGDAVAAAITATPSHTHVLEDPDALAETVMAMGLSAGTAFDIDAIQIAVEPAQ